MLADVYKNGATLVGVARTLTRTSAWLSLFSDGKAAVAILLAVGVAIHALSLRIVATVLPAAVGDIGGLRFFAWTTTVAVVSSIWGAALATALARSRGLKRAYRASALLFAIGSIGCAAAPDMAVFLAGRFCQGLGGGLLVALAYSAIQRIFPENLRTRAMVLVPSIWGAAALTGPLLGGAFAEWGLWRWAFWIDVLVALIIIALAEHSLPAQPSADGTDLAAEFRRTFGRLALLGSSVLALAIGSVWGVVSSAVALLVSIALLIMLLRTESIVRPMEAFRLLPTWSYQLNSVSGAASLSLALMMGGSTAIIYLPYVATAVGGYSPIIGGYLSALASITWTAGAFASASAGRDWVGRSIIFGPPVLALGLFLTGCALIVGSFAFAAVSVAFLGIGIGAAWAPLANLMIANASEAERDLSSAFISINQMIAQAFASTLAGMIANLGGFADLAPGATVVIRAVAWVFVLFAIAAAAAWPCSLIAVRLSAHRSDDEPAIRAGDA